jgi:hypothetical protein
MNIFEVLWNLVLDMISAVNGVWVWLNTPLSLEFKVLGVTIDLDFFNIGGMSPLAWLGVGLGALVVVRIIKGIIPGA